MRHVPFDEVTADILPSLRSRFGMPGSDAVTRTDHEVPGDPPRVLEFTEGALAIAERESLQRTRCGPAQQTDHRARVDAAGQESAQRHIAHGVIGAGALNDPPELPGLAHD